MQLHEQNKKLKESEIPRIYEENKHPFLAPCPFAPRQFLAMWLHIATPQKIQRK
jgi:hypothetical protein